MCFWNSQLRTRANGDSEKECWPNIVSQYTSGNNSSCNTYNNHTNRTNTNNNKNNDLYCYRYHR